MSTQLGFGAFVGVKLLHGRKGGWWVEGKGCTVPTFVREFALSLFAAPEKI